MSNKFPLIIADESTDARITNALRQAGYEILSIQQTMPGTNDLDVISIAITKSGYILTEDKDLEMNLFLEEFLITEQSF